MATYSSDGKSSRRGLRILLFSLIALFGAVALVLGLCLDRKVERAMAPEADVVFEELDSEALLSTNGWNDDIAGRLSATLATEGDNVALGNASGVVSTKVVSLGGYSWSVVYKQNGIVTLYANEPVAYLAFDEDSNSYLNSAIREYLNGEFYSEFVKKVGYSDFDSLIVPFGVRELYYQQTGAQNIPLNTLSGAKIENCDGVLNDKIWLPSAYEVGGFEQTEHSPEPRVNSFKTLKGEGFSINTGLWNLSNVSRLAVNDALLRSSAGDGVSYIKNGVICEGDSTQIYAIRPCFNMVLPEIKDGVVVSASESGYVDANTVFAGVTPDFTAQLRKYTQETAGNTFTPKKGNTTLDGVTMTYSQALLIELSDAVNAGQDMTGKTFNLVEDVDMSNVTVWNPIGRKNFVFSGTFNGQGYKISNLCSAGSGFVGLFGYVSGSSAKVYQVAVVDSSWYTTNNEVGAIAGVIANGAIIEQCYSESGISGGDYVGGIVGRSTSTSTITNCYNINGVAGVNNVGGIIGSNGGTTVTNCYNVGAVSAASLNAGGIVGENLTSGKYAGKNVYNQLNNTTSNANIANIAPAVYSDIQGTKLSTGIQKPVALSSWTFNGSPWTISAALNDNLPMLKVFIKEVTLNVRSSDSINKVSINGGAYASSATLTRSATATGAVTVKAQAQFTGSNHYVLNSWNYFAESIGGVIVSSDVVYAGAGNASGTGAVREFTLTFNTLDDSYNLEAVFEKLYSFRINSVFNGFSSGFTPAESELKVTYSATPFENEWYRQGDTVSVQIGTPESASHFWKFESWIGSINNGQSWDVAISVGASGSGSFVEANDSTNKSFTITIGHSAGYVSKDTFSIQMRFARYYLLTLDKNSVPAISNPPAITSTVTVSNPSATITANNNTASSPIEMRYDATISNNITTPSATYSPYYVFDSWKLSSGGTELGVYENIQNVSITIPSTVTNNNSIINLTMRAYFELAPVTVTIEEKVAGVTNSSAGIYTLSTNGSLTNISADSGALAVPYGSTIYLFILPNFASGYEFASFSLSSASNTQTSVGSAGLIRFHFVVTAAATYTINYQLASKFNISFTANLEGVPATAGVFTFNPASRTGLTINSSIATTVSCEEGKYFLRSVNVSYNGGNGVDIYSADRPGTGYVGAGSFDVFSVLGSASQQTVSALLSKIGATAVYNGYDFVVKANFIGIVRTITVNEIWHGKDINGEPISIAHDKAYTITDTNTNKVVNGQGILNNSHRLVASPGQGYRVTGIEIVGMSVTPQYSGTVWVNHVGTVNFTLNDNVVIKVTYEVRSYEVRVEDNLTELGTYGNTYTYYIGGSQVTPTNNAKIYVNVGSTLTVSGYDTIRGGTSSDATKHELRTMTVKADSSSATPITPIGAQWSRTFAVNDNFSTLTLELTYAYLRAVNIELRDAEVDTGTERALIVLTPPENSGLANIVLLVAKDETSKVFCDNEIVYTVTAVVPVYVSTSADGGKTTITIGESNNVTVKLAQDLAKSNVFSSEVFQ